jgi:glycyl-tRNA synthetase beta chain
VASTDKGEYVSAMIEEAGRETGIVLAEALPGVIASLHFPKSMRWGAGNIRFVRPIQWVTAIFNSQEISFELDGIRSSDMTCGHRFLSPGNFKIHDPSTYTHTLLNNYVIADPDARKNIIKGGIKKLESSIGCLVHKDEELLETVTYLTEYPTVIMGNFSADYLSLPRELLITVMKSHQKYFSVEDRKGNLMPHFILVSNTKPENNDTVRKGAERVLRARLEDARFYVDEDQKKPLWDYVEYLKDVTFQEKLGSIFEKVERMAFICSFIAEELNLPNKEKILRAAMLSKADLVTGIVREFPELQGYMGMMYARNSGEEEEVALAVFEHYLPKFSGDSLPSSETGTLLSLSDKLDNIVSFFLIDLVPTGSEDPYGLRRQAMGIIKMLQDTDYNLPLPMLIKKALQGVEGHLTSRETLFNEILKFFYQRLEGIFINDGFSHDLVQSVLSVCEVHGNETIRAMKNRIVTLSQFKKEANFPELVTAAKRVYNILSKATYSEAKKELLKEKAEKELFSKVVDVKSRIAHSDFTSLFELIQPINTFFDSVLVMDKNEKVRLNRLGLLFSVRMLFDAIGDFSKIVE